MHQWAILIMAKQAAAVDAGTPNHPSIIETAPSKDIRRYDAAAVSAATTVAHLMERQRLDWGVDHFPVIVIQPITLSAFALLDDLQCQESRSALISLCITIRAVSRRFKVAKGVLRALQTTAEEKKIRLPEETAQLFHEYERESPSGRADDTGDVGLAYLLEKWDDLDFDFDSGEEESP